jgi:predicted TIM-barrel fold metal-dependent hydrolase
MGRRKHDISGTDKPSGRPAQVGIPRGDIPAAPTPSAAVPRRGFLKGTSLILPIAMAATGAVAAGLGSGETSPPASTAPTPTPRPARRPRRAVSPLDAADELMEYLEALTIIDSHEHLFPEKDRINHPVDVLTLLHNYEYHDAVSAGMPPASPGDNPFLDDKRPFEERWKRLWPFIQRIRHGGYFRANAIALRDIHGIEELNPETAAEASRRVRELNRRGSYDEILRRRCRIETCLVQNTFEEQDPPDLLRPVVMTMQFYQNITRENAREAGTRAGIEVTGLDAYLKAVDWHLERHRSRGAAGIKIWVRPYAEVDAATAKAEFDTLLKQGTPSRAAEMFVLLHLLGRCAEWEWPVAVHTGVWGDFRTLEPRLAMDFVIRHPGIRFDIYHLGIPHTTECIYIAKSFANAHLNLCWTYLVSETIARTAVNEVVDAVPVNKVFGFGGDMVLGLESVYGHLVMARQSLAAALGQRIAEGRIDPSGAREVLKLWLYDNPKSFYRLG